MKQALSTAKGERRGQVPANLAPYTFRTGQSGNPGGKGGTYYEAQRICRDASPKAARVMIELLSSEDDRVRLMAAREIYERAWGPPKAYDPATEKSEKRPKFNPRDYSPRELDVIETALKLMLRPPAVVPGAEDADEP